MKKILFLLFIPFLANSQVVIDTTLPVSLVTYELSWDSSYHVKYHNDTNIEVTFQWQLKKYVDGELSKNETRTETKQIAGTQYVNVLLSPQIVNGVKAILENRKKTLKK